VNKAIIPIVARLQALQTASHVVSGRMRTIAEGSDRQPLAALLREVNETVLGRTLAFASGAGPQVTLEVAGRRVLRLVAAEGIAGADACLAAHTLDDGHKDDLIRILQAVTPRGHPVSVGSHPIGRGGDEVSVGLPVALLADLLLIDLDALPGSAGSTPASLPDNQALDMPLTGAMLQRFALQFGPSLMAWLIIGGDDDGAFAGPDEMVSHLGGFLDNEGAALSAQLDRLATHPGGAVSLMLGASLLEGHGTLCARQGGGLLLGLLEGETAQLLPRAWATALAKG